MTLAIGCEGLKNRNQIVTRAFKLLCLVLLICTVVITAYAQSETATISGLVTDEGGGSVPSCEVVLQSVERGTTTTARTNDAGIYVFASVQPGQYNLTIKRSGFKQVDFLGMIVNVQDHIEQNFRLQVGSVSESVTVEASGLNINTTDATVSTVVDRQFAENLPLNGRSFQTLIYLTPGVVPTASTTTDGGQFSVNGQRAVSNYWMVDGVSANIGVGVSVLGTAGNGLGGSLGSFSAQGGTNGLVSIDAMQEFRIQTSTFAPEFGRTPGAQISIITRSGANQVHGTAFDYFRNDALDANDWFADQNGLPKPRERQNDFGGTFSGPIRKDQTFFFFSYEGLRLRLPQVALTEVPDMAARQNAIPAVQPFLNAFPLPNGTDSPATGVAQLNASFSNSATLDAYSLRIDHRINEKLTLFGRYNYSPSQTVQRGNCCSLNTVSPGNITTQTATVGATWALSPAILNDLRFNYSRTNAFSHSYLDSFNGAVPIASSPFPAPFSTRDANFSIGINSLGANGFIAEGISGRQIQRQINIVDSLSVQKGSHSLKFGIDFRRLSPIVSNRLYSQNGTFSDVPSAEGGNLLSSNLTSGRGGSLLFHNFGAFAQDTWRVVPRVTLTYGLRWDIDFAPSTASGPGLLAVTGYNLNDLSKLALAPSGTPAFNTTYGNVAPRIGIAYDLRQNKEWQTVLRGGFGVFYDLVTSEVGNLNFEIQYPFGASTSASGGTFPLSPAAAAPPPIVPPIYSKGDCKAIV